MMDYKQFLQEMDKIKAQDGVDAAFGYVKGVVQSTGVLHRLEERITKLELDADLTKPTACVAAEQLALHKKRKEEKKLGKIAPKKRVYTKAKFTGKAIRTKILNVLKLHDHLNSKDLVDLTQIPYPSLMAKLAELVKEGKVEKQMRGKNRKAGYNWMLPEADKVQVRTVTGVTH